MRLFFVVDDSIQDYPVFYLVVGENHAREYYDNEHKIFEIGTRDGLISKLSYETCITLLDITAGSNQWTPFE